MKYNFLYTIFLALMLCQGLLVAAEDAVIAQTIASQLSDRDAQEQPHNKDLWEDFVIESNPESDKGAISVGEGPAQWCHYDPTRTFYGGWTREHPTGVTRASVFGDDRPYDMQNRFSPRHPHMRSKAPASVQAGGVVTRLALNMSRCKLLKHDVLSHHRDVYASCDATLYKISNVLHLSRVGASGTLAAIEESLPEYGREGFRPDPCTCGRWREQLYGWGPSLHHHEMFSTPAPEREVFSCKPQKPKPKKSSGLLNFLSFFTKDLGQ